MEVENAVEALLADGAASYRLTLETDCAFWPHLEVAAQTCHERLTAPRPVQLASIDAMLSNLATHLDHVGRQVLVFELGLAHECDGVGSDMEVRDLSQPSSTTAEFIGELLAEYPGLRELLSVLTADAIRNTVEIERALLCDFQRICEVVIPERWKGRIELADITEIEWESSETHERGKVVASLGTAACPKMFAYKPRCVAAEDRLTSRWRSWSQRNPRMSNWDLPNYLPRDSYGWASWMPQTECGSQSEVEDYFYRAGWLMALATTFGVTDLNRDNIVACGASPVPVDLEAASHHRKCRFAPSREGRLLPRQLEWNAMSTGLLPMWIWKGEDLSGVDLSGFGGVDDQWCSVPVQQFVGRNTRSEKLVKSGVRLFPGRNVVKRDGRIQPPWEFVDLLLEGYQDCLHQLAGDRGWVASVLREIRDGRVRFLARPTAGYHYAIQASFHPVYLRDPAKRRRFLAGCLKDGSANATMFVEAEVEACYYGDIPRFAGTPAELLVSETSQGDEISVPDDEYVPGYH
ncbi:MAG: type 2 lanthipeptide synthetase LanM, partial [Terrimicrobiaceae bacterium]